ncbi:DUF429 domain-containing protein [Candidatus Woesearchaeota archaeon]|nr:DUF429 domain-containing protein [Candidatus Woesearchaeota archaeon]
MASARFIGIDLAWSTRNGTGVAALAGDARSVRLIASDVVMTDDEILSFVEEHRGGGACHVAVDAPLLVPNRTGRRIAEVKVGELFRHHHAGAHPANRERLTQWTGSVRGEVIAQRLVEAGFAHDPYLQRHDPGSKVFEVYPHPSMVVLFGLPRILQYKAKPKRDYASRYREFGRYQKHLAALRRSTPSLVLPDTIINKKVEGMKGRALKRYEDLLDAVFCAYIACYAWAHPERCAVLGNLREGYIMTPVFGKKGEREEKGRGTRKGR